MAERRAELETEEFAKALVEQVRDCAIRSCDFDLQPNAANPIAKRWRGVAKSNSHEVFAKALIPDIVDSAISHLLVAIDQGLLRLLFAASTGKSLDLAAVAKDFGELSGSYMGSGGRIERYSKERYVDDFADLKDFFGKPTKNPEVPSTN